VAEAVKRAPTMKTDEIVLINLSGRGDKDLDTVVKALGMEVGR
jgi:tryptophan synthase beta chain